MVRNIQIGRAQRGVMLLEALIAILLFAMGILALIGLQARSITFASQARYQTDAAVLADRVISQMWGDRTNIAGYAWDGTGGAPAVISAWATQVTNSLPGANTQAPTIVVATVNHAGPPAYSAHTVTVTVFWRTPDEAGAGQPHHNLTTTAFIQCC